MGGESESGDTVCCSFPSCESEPIEKSTSMWQPIELWVIWVAFLHSMYMELKGLSQERSWREKMTNFSLVFPFPGSMNCSWLVCVTGSRLRKGWLLRRMGQGWQKIWKLCFFFLSSVDIFSCAVTEHVRILIPWSKAVLSFQITSVYFLHDLLIWLCNKSFYFLQEKLALLYKLCTHMHRHPDLHKCKDWQWQKWKSKKATAVECGRKKKSGLKSSNLPFT